MFLLLIIAGLYLALLLLKVLLALSYSRRVLLRHSRGEESMQPETLTIAQAILSGDATLESRLDANLTELSGQCFLWLIDDDDDEAQRIAATLVKKHADARLRVELCPPCPAGINPKVWKLRHGATLVTTPYFCVLDDDTTISAASAATLVSVAQDHTIATGLPCYDSVGGAASQLLSQFVNNSSAFTYLATSRLLPAITVNGMGYVLRSEEFTKFHHFEPILHHLTDDYAIATLVLQRGGNIHQSTAPLRVQTNVRDFSHYIELMHRWYVFAWLLLKRQSRSVQFVIFCLHGLPSFLLLAIVSLTIFTRQGQPWFVLLAVLVMRYIFLSSTLRRYFGANLHRVWYSIASELLQPLHLIHALCCRTIRWRKRRYRVFRNDYFTES